MALKYATVRADYEYLASVATGGDMVEIDAAVFDLMENPTKGKAAELYDLAIREWFKELGRDEVRDQGISLEYLSDKKVRRIATRYGIDLQQWGYF